MSQANDGFCTIDEALAELRAGRMIVLVDDQYRENEGDLVIAAEKVTPEAINFMVRNGCGILGLALSPAICDRLHLEPLPGNNVDPQATPWTPHIDARYGITTGTSAHDRARTISVAIDDRTTPNDIMTVHINGETIDKFTLLDTGGPITDFEHYRIDVAAPVPGPIVGAGLPGLIGGAFGLWMLGRRRVQKWRSVA